MPQNKYYTMMIMPASSSRFYRYSVPKWLLVTAAVLGGCAFFIFLALIINAARHEDTTERVAILQRANTQQKERLHQFSNTINELKMQMLQLQAFDKKLRVITAFGKPDHRLPFIGIGGPTSEITLEEIKNDPSKQKRLMAAIQKEIEQLSLAAERQADSFKELEKFFSEKRTLLVSTPSIWPTRGWLTSTFGYRTSPFTGLREMHEGIDVAGSFGAPVVAPGNGVITKIGNESGYGKVLEIDHGYGVATRYGHLAKILVKEGERVERGDEIAQLGNSGRSTGPHLHYEVWVNKIPINPVKYILEDDVHTLISGLAN
ncbi:MAG: M23 family metallopeptidase [Candidatus Tectomicrobia bacterium]|nr:M23 family metallopeptidase [Candidatus Tectomicrobia bacterium]